MQNMDNAPVIQIEVLVPYFTLPVVSPQSEPPLPEARDDPGSADAHTPDVTISTLAPGGREQASEQCTSTVYTTRKGLFRLFRLPNLSLYGQSLALRIFHRWPRMAHTLTEAEATHEMAFSITYQDSMEASGKTIKLLPGLNQVVITLDDEGLPQGYSIDGTEG